MSNVSKFNGEYFVDPTGAIDAFEGGFVQVENDISIIIPFKGFTSGGRKRDSITEGDINKDSWALPLIAHQGTLTYGLGAIGMDPKAKLTKDDFDLITPPKLSDYLEIYSEHPEHFMKQFTRDIVPTAEEFVWQFHSASNVTGQLVLEWDNTLLSNGGKDLYLMDLGVQRIVNMSEVNSYSFDPYYNPSFRIYFGENLESKIKPEWVALIDPYPNPSTGISNIDYALSDAATSYYVKLEVYDMMGKVLSTLVDAEKPPGFYRSQWNAKANPVGLYAVRLTVQTAGEQKIFTKKIVVK